MEYIEKYGFLFYIFVVILCLSFLAIELNRIEENQKNEKKEDVVLIPVDFEYGTNKNQPSLGREAKSEV